MSEPTPLRSHLLARPELLPAAALVAALCAASPAVDHPAATVGVILSPLAALLAVALLLRAPRVLLHVLALGLLLAVAGAQVLSVSRGAHDASSDRDEAAEIAGRALLDGRNPWRESTSLGNQVTTGPTGVLLAAASVAATGGTTPLALGFWILLAAALAALDLSRRNDSLPLTVPLLLLPPAGLLHAAFWNLEELFLGALLLVLAWALVERGRAGTAGAAIAAAVLLRTSWALPALGLVLWRTLRRPRPTVRDALRAALGAAAAGVVLIVPFVLVAGGDLARVNFLSVGVWKSAGLPFVGPIRSAPEGPPVGAILLGLAFSAALLAAAAFALARAGADANPFWLVALGAVLAHGLFRRPLPVDYLPAVTLPLAFALAASRRRP